MTVVVGTAGHIDHGKTSLLRALTGIDADRLPEERRRGMTIDVGYAHLALPDGTELDFVDVPGHDRLIGNMLVGAGEIDAVLLVVAADDGPRAQTLEHLELIDGLGIRHGIAVVTKIDGLASDDPRRAEVPAAVAHLLARTTLADSPVLSASSVTGEGIDEVRAALIRLRDMVTAHRDRRPRPTRLAIDRVFAIRGRGTVVTGTLRGGPVRMGRALRIEPGSLGMRIRGLEVHGRPVEESPVSGRLAANIGGVEASAIHRGAAITDGAGVVASSGLLVALTRPTRLGPVQPAWPLAAGTSLRLHLGTDQVSARIRRSRWERLDPGSEEEDDLVRLVLERPIAVSIGDPFVLRHPSPGSTAAGGIVLDAEPAAGVSRRRASAARLAALVAVVRQAADEIPRGAGDPIAALVDLHGVLPSARGAEIAGALGLSPTVPQPTRDRPTAGQQRAAEPPAVRQLAGHLVAEDVARSLADVATAAVSSDRAPSGVQLAELRRGLAASLRRVATVGRPEAIAIASGAIDALVSAGRLRREGELVRDPSARPGPSPELAEAMDRLEAALSGASPPSLAEAALRAGCPPEGVRALESAGRLVRLADDLAWSFATYRDLAALALRMADPGPLSPAAFRDATGSSRRYVLAILEDLDRRGLLERTQGGHVLGKRAPRPIGR